jgi:mercuric reductase
VEAEHFLVATGSTPWVPPIPGLAEAGYLTSTTALELEELPASMIVLGGGAIGLELGQLFARLGVRVTIVEALPRLAPAEETEISAVLDGVLRAEGIVTSPGTVVTAVRRDSSGVTVTGTRDGQPIELHAERLLVATGRRPATTGLNLDAVGGTAGPGGEIEVDAHLRTAHPRIWAAGDVTGQPQFVYVAANHGAIAAENALDDADRTVDYRALPRVTFTAPGIASVGLTEAQAIEHGYACDCRLLPLAHVPRAIVDRDTRGLIKLVADARTGRLLGAHVAAHAAGEVIAAAVYALANQMTVQQMAELWCPYLTMAEGLKLAAQAFTRDISRLSCCAA